MSRKLPSQRGGSRYKAVQALYQWLVTGDEMADIEEQFSGAELFDEEFAAEEEDTKHINKSYFRKLVREIAVQTDTLDAQLAPLLDRKVEQLDPVERAILWIGAYEINSAKMPWRAVINEAIELSKLFGQPGSHKYINGVLDKLARQRQSMDTD